MLHSTEANLMTKRSRGMNRGSTTLFPYMALVAAFAFGLAGVAAPHHGVAQGCLAACILLAALSLITHLRFTSLSGYDRRRR
jgi:hypothetical protein